METKFSKRQKRDKPISLRVEEELLKWIDKKSKKENKTRTQFIIDCVAEKWSEEQ